MLDSVFAICPRLPQAREKLTMTLQSLPLPTEAESLMESLIAQMRAAQARVDAKKYEGLLLKAWALIPEPKLNYDRAPSTARALVIHYRDVGDFDAASAWLGVLREAYGPAEDPSVEFVAATVAMESGDSMSAFALFDRLHSRFGVRPFKNYDAKYLRFYRSMKERAR